MSCRIKSFEFAEKGFKFDIPRMMTLSDCAFRILFTKYDHFSAKSKSYYPRRKKKEGIAIAMIFPNNQFLVTVISFLAI